MGRLPGSLTDVTVQMEQWGIEEVDSIDFYTFLYILQDIDLPSVVRTRVHMDSTVLNPGKEYGATLFSIRRSLPVHIAECSAW
jgi:hypothetical protein